MKKFLSIAILALITLAVGCKTADNNTSNRDDMKPDSSLKNTLWVLKTLYNKKITTPENSREISFVLQHDKDIFRGFGGCNNISGEVACSTNNTIQFGGVISTKMHCDNQQNEDEFLKALKSADSYKIKGESLTLLSKGKVIATFNALYL